MPDKIELTPNYDHLYQTFKREAQIKAEALDTPEAISQACELLVPINICLQSATTGATIMDMREWLSELVTVLRIKEARLNDTAERGYTRNDYDNGGLL